MGFDDMEPGYEEEGFLSTVQQPFSEIGRNAVRSLLQRIEEPDALTKKILISTQIIERTSVKQLINIPAPEKSIHPDRKLIAVE